MESEVPGQELQGFEEFPGEWYLLSDENHFWMQWRLEVFLRRLKRLRVELEAPAACLDIGCGTGAFRDQIEARTGWVVDGVELDERARALARPGRGTIASFDILSEPAERMERYDHVFLFDVVEHVQAPRPFLEAALRYLRTGGLVHINVPALQSLFSRYDEAAGHHRRYDRPGLRGEMAGLGVQPLDVGYWGLSLLPALLWRKVAVARKTDQVEIIRAGFDPPRPWLHAAAKAVMRVETGLLLHPPIGSSLMFIGRKS